MKLKNKSEDETETEFLNSLSRSIKSAFRVSHNLYHSTIYTPQAHTRGVTKFRDVMRGKSARARQ